MHRDGALRRVVGRAGSLVVFAGAVQLAAAQSAPDEERASMKLEVTGSNIPRTDAESALPVQILTRKDIAHTGAATTPELMSRISANILGFNDELSLINSFYPNQPGLASANLRGIGDGSTLVLLNGRRLANYAFNGGTVDLNAIPLSAIERVEILKDGASAIYGTDAIAGVVNFILRKDFHGIEAAADGAWTQHGGADAHQASVTAGYGDLSTDRFNAFATLSYRREEALHATDRPFSRTGYIPDEGVLQLSGASFPASIQARPGAPPSLINPAFPNGCAPPTLIPVALPNLSRTPFCGYDFTSAIDVLPQVERTNVMGRATFQASADHQLFAEADYAYNRFLFRDSPTSVFQAPLSIPQPVVYPSGGPY